MKKHYSKPCMFVENFKSQTAVPISCNYSADSDGNPIPFNLGHGLNLFLDNNADCVFTPENQFIEICYHSFDPNHTVFQS